MTIQQLTLMETAPTVAAPRCRMCVRPARWVTGAEEWGMYCAGRACSNRDRICQACGGPFHMGVDGAGTKYCSTDCKVAGKHPERSASGRVCCAWCDRPSDQYRQRSAKWPYICAECIHPLRQVAQRLKDHNVPHDRARRLLTDPGCEVCGIDMLTPVRNSARKIAALLVVDHDHACCPVDTHSCGRCVRGLICRGCNAAAGQLYDSPDSARSLAAYLDGWASRKVTA